MGMGGSLGDDPWCFFYLLALFIIRAGHVARYEGENPHALEITDRGWAETCGEISPAMISRRRRRHARRGSPPADGCVARSVRSRLSGRARGPAPSRWTGPGRCAPGKI